MPPLGHDTPDGRFGRAAAFSKPLLNS